MIRNICSLLICLILFGLVAPCAVRAAPLSVDANAALLMDVKTGEVLFEKNSSKRCPPASTTKILTAIIAIESGRLDDEVRISQKAASTPGSTMNLHAGQLISLRELLAGLLMRSGNDAAVAIAEYLAGSVNDFADLMNKKAQALGAVNSHFRNPHGLTAPGHYTTAFDLALITRYAISNPVFADIVSTKETKIEWQDRRGRERDQNLRNTNRLLWMFEDADGVKTGTTGAAGPCLVSSATRGNQKLLAVVLNDHSRWYDSMKLLTYGFDNYDLYEYAVQGDVLATLPVEKGLIPLTDIMVATPAALVVKTEDSPYVSVEVDLPEKIKAPVYEGQKIGEIVFYVHNKAVKTVDLIAARDIGERTVPRLVSMQLYRIFRLLASWGTL